jgi:hypothetical protein
MLVSFHNKIIYIIYNIGLSMKFILTFIFCSGLANQCLPPIEYEGSYPDLYTCLDAGYRESIVQLGKIGPTEVNEKRIFIKFFCSPTQET